MLPMVVCMPSWCRTVILNIPKADVKGGKQGLESRFCLDVGRQRRDVGDTEIRAIHENNPNYAVVDVKQPGQVALLNGGFDGIPVREGEKYDLSVFAKQFGGKRRKDTGEPRAGRSGDGTDHP